jgi:hypothetical protein
MERITYVKMSNPARYDHQADIGGKQFKTFYRRTDENLPIEEGITKQPYRYNREQRAKYSKMINSEIWYLKENNDFRSISVSAISSVYLELKVEYAISVLPNDIRALLKPSKNPLVLTAFFKGRFSHMWATWRVEEEAYVAINTNERAAQDLICALNGEGAKGIECGRELDVSKTLKYMALLDRRIKEREKEQRRNRIEELMKADKDTLKKTLEELVK